MSKEKECKVAVTTSGAVYRVPSPKLTSEVIPMCDQLRKLLTDPTYIHDPKDPLTFEEHDQGIPFPPKAELVHISELTLTKEEREHLLVFEHFIVGPGPNDIVVKKSTVEAVMKGLPRSLSSTKAIEALYPTTFLTLEDK